METRLIQWMTYEEFFFFFLFFSHGTVILRRECRIADPTQQLTETPSGPRAEVYPKTQTTLHLCLGRGGNENKETQP